jgi:predicted phage terminase large subunit-like protein
VSHELFKTAHSANHVSQFTAWLLGHNASSKIICASYAQDLADKHARDTRTLMTSSYYQKLFPTRMSSKKQAVSEFMTTRRGFRMATSVGGVLTGRGADFIIIDDPLKPEEAVSEAQRRAANSWFDSSVVSRLDNKKTGCIIIIMQRLHQDDLVGHVLEHGGWTVLRLPAIAEEEEAHIISLPFGGTYIQHRAIGEALHPEREPIEVLEQLRQTLGEYNFAGQYQQTPAPLGGGMVKSGWFNTYTEKSAKYELIFQSWDTANKATELSDYSVCTTWGLQDKKFYLLQVLRKRLEYPELKRLVVSHARIWDAKNVLIEDKASGTQLIQDLTRDGFYGVTRYSTSLDKIMRMQTVTPVIENGLVHIPEKAEWLAVYLHELTTFPGSKFDDQVDSTSQALDWIKKGHQVYGLSEYLKLEADRAGFNPGAENPAYYKELMPSLYR